jgi:hypothetical protein
MRLRRPPSVLGERPLDDTNRTHTGAVVSDGTVHGGKHSITRLPTCPHAHAVRAHMHGWLQWSLPGRTLRSLQQPAAVLQPLHPPKPHLLSRSASLSISSTSSRVTLLSHSLDTHLTCSSTSRRSSTLRVARVRPPYSCCSSAARTVRGVCTSTWQHQQGTAHSSEHPVDSVSSTRSGEEPCKRLQLVSLQHTQCKAWHQTNKRLARILTWSLPCGINSVHDAGGLLSEAAHTKTAHS